MKSYLAAAVQMTSKPDLAKNLIQAEELIELAVRQGAELVSLPENFAFLGKEIDKVAQAKEIALKTEQFLKKMAQRFQITILGGGFPVPVADNPNKAYNTAVLITPDGQQVAHYQKVHLFDVDVPDGNTYQESSTVMAGQEIPPIYESEHLGKLGLSICYDVRFPEFYRYLSRQGADVLFIPWQTLLPRVDQKLSAIWFRW